MKIFEEKDLSIGISLFIKETQLNIDKKDIAKIEQWLKEKKSLSKFFSSIAFGSCSECCLLNDQIIIKTGLLRQINMMYYQQQTIPFLQNYIVPTYVFKLKNKCIVSKEHLHYMQQNNLEYSSYSDCFILQPYCNRIKTKEEEYLWRQQANILNSYSNILDIKSSINLGFFNNQPVLFDW